MTARTMFTPTDFGPYPWMEYALRELGTSRVRGSGSNPRVVEYLGAAGMASANDETAWCSAFVNWVMQQIGVRGTHRPNARSWLAWDGLCLGKPQYGAITILSRRGAHSSFGHVGFYVGEDHGEIVVLGGNQTNASSVCLNNYPMSRILGYRWPPGYPLPR